MAKPIDAPTVTAKRMVRFAISLSIVNSPFVGKTIRRNNVLFVRESRTVALVEAVGGGVSFIFVPALKRPHPARNMSEICAWRNFVGAKVVAYKRERRNEERDPLRCSAPAIASNRSSAR